MSTFDGNFDLEVRSLTILQEINDMHSVFPEEERTEDFDEELNRLHSELSACKDLGGLGTSQLLAREFDQVPNREAPIVPQLEAGPETIGWLAEAQTIELEDMKTPNNQPFLWADITGLQHRFAGVLSRRGEEQRLRQKLVRTSQIHIGALLDFTKPKHIRVEGGQDAFNVTGMAAYKDTPRDDWRSVMLRTEVNGLPTVLFACLYPKNKEDSFLNILKKNGLR